MLKGFLTQFGFDSQDRISSNEIKLNEEEKRTLLQVVTCEQEFQSVNYDSVATKLLETSFELLFSQFRNADDVFTKSFFLGNKKKRLFWSSGF